jgi:type IX secretion system PorP/SprF family membrane protein
MNNYIKISIYIICALSFQKLSAQNNLHYSQFYNAPMFTNPALTGQIGEDLFRLNAHNRMQNSGFGDAGGYLYKTMSAGIDLSLFHKKLGTGLYMTLDDAGGVFKTFQFMPSLSYSFHMGDNILTFGAQGLYNVTSVDLSNAQWGGPVQNFSKGSDYFDVNAGTNFKLDLYYIRANIGLAVSNLLRKEQRYGLTAIQGTRVPMLFKAYTNVEFDMTDKLQLLPSILAEYEAGSTNFVLGSNFSYKLFDGGVNGNSLIMGLFARTNNGNLEALIPKFGMKMNKLLIMGSYDFDIAMSKAGFSNYFQGFTNTFEISIIFTGKPKIVPPLLEDDFLLNPRY